MVRYSSPNHIHHLLVDVTDLFSARTLEGQRSSPALYVTFYKRKKTKPSGVYLCMLFLLTSLDGLA